MRPRDFLRWLEEKDLLSDLQKQLEVLLASDQDAVLRLVSNPAHSSGDEFIAEAVEALQRTILTLPDWVLECSPSHIVGLLRYAMEDARLLSDAECEFLGVVLLALVETVRESAEEPLPSKHQVSGAEEAFPPPHPPPWSGDEAVEVTPGPRPPSAVFERRQRSLGATLKAAVRSASAELDQRTEKLIKIRPLLQEPLAGEGDASEVSPPETVTHNEYLIGLTEYLQHMEEQLALEPEQREVLDMHRSTLDRIVFLGKMAEALKQTYSRSQAPYPPESSLVNEFSDYVKIGPQSHSEICRTLGVTESEMARIQRIIADK